MSSRSNFDAQSIGIGAKVGIILWEPRFFHQVKASLL